MSIISTIEIIKEIIKANNKGKYILLKIPDNFLILVILISLSVSLSEFSYLTLTYYKER